MSYRIITISRQFGSGGHEIGEKLAKALGINFYDNTLIDLAIDYGQVNSDVLKSADEKRPSSLLYSIFEDSNEKTGYHLPVQDAMYNLQSGVIRSLSEKESCVIVGRCADYVLKGRRDTLSAFIIADLDARTKRIMTRDNLSEKSALAKVKKTDKARASYYQYYTSQSWSNPTSYDIVLNSSKLGIDSSVQLLRAMYLS